MRLILEVIHRFSLKLFVVIFDLLNYFRDLIVNISFFPHLRANFLCGIHHCCVVSVPKVSSNLRKLARDICALRFDAREQSRPAAQNQ
jgi:hypothetical protein